jgi:hypothetical protein
MCREVHTLLSSRSREDRYRYSQTTQLTDNYTSLNMFLKH